MKVSVCVYLTQYLVVGFVDAKRCINEHTVAPLPLYSPKFLYHAFYQAVNPGATASAFHSEKPVQLLGLLVPVSADSVAHWTLD